MGLISGLFGSKEDVGSDNADLGRLREADEAIRDGRAGRIPVPVMLQRLFSAQAFVSLAGPPTMTGHTVASWKPATVTKQDRGSQFVVAFTDESLASAFATNNRTYSHLLLVNLAWLIEALPKEHGIVFNVGSDNGFEWSAAGIAAFKAQ
jgi:hypothetical protein